jgi:UDP-4-amino-4,6-dideoxy-N-acetyl-beta-L-altrosamine transaminase
MARTSIKQIPYGHQSIDNQDIKAVVDTLKSGWLTQGPKVLEFEEKFAKFVGSRYAVAVSSGTAALHAACAASGIGSTDEVIVPTLSFVATANCVLYCSAKPVLVDVYHDTLTINVEEAEKKITKKTKAIIAVDFAGHPAEWGKLKKLARKHKLILIDDAAHALGSKYKGALIGSIADLTTFSFHPVKTITSGEGGMVTTNNKVFYQKLLRFRNHGIYKDKKLSKKIGSWYYEVRDLGYNYRLTDMQAALGINQLKKIESFSKKRRAIWKKYQQAFSGDPRFELPIEKKGTQPVWHIFPVRLNLKKINSNRRSVFEKLKKSGIGVHVFYIPIHKQPLYFKQFKYKKSEFPVADDYYERALILPLFPSLTSSEQSFIISELETILK